MPRGVYKRKPKKRFYRRGKVIAFNPSRETAQAIEHPPAKTLWDVVSGWKLDRLKAIFERIPLD